MSDEDTSSANPAALEAFVTTAMQLDARLELGAVSLRAAIAEFNATCREYPTGIDESLADQLQDLARRNMEMNLWVRQVTEQFAQADTGLVDSGADSSAAFIVGPLTDGAAALPVDDVGPPVVDDVLTQALSMISPLDGAGVISLPVFGLGQPPDTDSARDVALPMASEPPNGEAPDGWRADAPVDRDIPDAGLLPLTGTDVGLSDAGLLGVTAKASAAWTTTDEPSGGEPAGIGSSDRWYADEPVGKVTPDAVLPPLTGEDIGLSDAGLMVGVLGVVGATDQSIEGKPPSIGASDRWYTDQAVTNDTSTALSATLDLTAIETASTPSTETPPWFRPATNHTGTDTSGVAGDDLLSNARVDPPAEAGPTPVIGPGVQPVVIGVGGVQTAVAGMGKVAGGPGVVADLEYIPSPQVTDEDVLWVTPPPELPPANQGEIAPSPPLITTEPDHGPGLTDEGVDWVPLKPDVLVSDDVGQQAPLSPKTPIYEDNPKHGSVPRIGPGGVVIGRRATNGPTALENSVQVKRTSPARLGVDPTTGEIVQLQRHTVATADRGDAYHGYVVTWDDLRPDERKALIDAKLVNKVGKILISPP